MTLETRPAWVTELQERLGQPFTSEELAGLGAWAQRLAEMNAGQTWPAGTFRRLLDLTRSEDAERGA